MMMIRRLVMGSSRGKVGQLAVRQMATNSHFLEVSDKTRQAIDLEKKYAAHTYAPIPVVLTSGSGCMVEDVDGKQYYDFLSAYSSLNQGHSHPRLVQVMQEQAGKLALTSRAFHSDTLGPYCELMNQVFGYDKVLPMNSGVEAFETAVKVSRKWAYEVHGTRPEHAKIVVMNDNFHGRTLTAVSASTDPESYQNYGPYVPGFVKVPYDDIGALQAAVQTDSDIIGVMLEPIQGEAGVRVPQDGYLRAVRDLCDKHKILMIADEVQTGLARTGKMLCCDHEQVRPDVVALGKALSGGMYPVSAVLADDDVMLTIKPGQHGSTFGGSPLGARIAMEAVQIILDEGLADRAERLGQRLRQALTDLQQPLIRVVRGKGLLNAVVVDHPEDPDAAYNICTIMARRGLLAKPTHGTIIRFAPPLIITEAQLDQCVEIIDASFKEYSHSQGVHA